MVPLIGYGAGRTLGRPQQPAGAVCAGSRLCGRCDPIIPLLTTADTHDGPNTLMVERVEPLEVACLGGPHLHTIQKGREDDSLIHTSLAAKRQGLVIKNGSFEGSEHS